MEILEDSQIIAMRSQLIFNVRVKRTVSNAQVSGRLQEIFCRIEKTLTTIGHTMVPMNKIQSSMKT